MEGHTSIHGDTQKFKDINHHSVRSDQHQGGWGGAVLKGTEHQLSTFWGESKKSDREDIVWEVSRVGTH